MKNRIIGLLMLSTLSMTMVSCESYRTASTMSPDEFVYALNAVSGYSVDEGGYELMKDVGDTHRVGYFVIYNPTLGFLGDYQAVSLSFIRNIEVYSSSLGVNSAVARSFAGMVSNNSLNRHDAEELDIDGLSGFFTNRYRSESDGAYEYDFGRSTRDTGLTDAEQEGKVLAQKALKMAGVYEMNLEAAAKITILGQKVQNMIGEGVSQEEISEVTASQMENILGVSSMEELSSNEGLKAASQNIGISESGLSKLMGDLSEL